MTPRKVSRCIHSCNRGQIWYLKTLPWWWKSASHFLRPDFHLLPQLTKFSKFKSQVLLVLLTVVGDPNLFWSCFQTKLKSQLKKVSNFSSPLLFQHVFLLPTTKIMEAFCCSHHSVETPPPKSKKVWKHGNILEYDLFRWYNHFQGQSFQCQPVPQMQAPIKR